MSAAENEAKKLLNTMFIKLDNQISPKTDDYRRLLQAADPFVGSAATAKARCKNVMDLLTCLRKNSLLGIRKFDVLKDILRTASLQELANGLVTDTEKEIQQILESSGNTENNGSSKLKPATDGSMSDGAVSSTGALHEADGTPTSVPQAVASAGEMEVEENMTVDATGVPPNPDGSGAVYPGNRGYVLILNYKEDRKGTQFDVDGLEKFFEDELQYKVVIKDDLTKSEVENQLRKVRDQLDTKPRRYDFFFLVVLSHGEDKGVLRLQRNKKIERITLEEIVDEFKNNSMNNFVGCPRVFIIQACCGREDQQGWETDHEVEETKRFLPTDANLLVVSSTTPGNVSFRDPKSGTIFIKELVKVFRQHHKTKHLETMLTIVKRNIAEGHGELRNKQMPCTWSTLIKDLHLRPNEK